jgi:hypothetical protein
MSFKVKEGDVIFCSSRLTWKSVQKYPMRFLIQATTFSKYEHSAQFINGKVAEAKAKKGTILTPLDGWIKSRYNFVTLDVLRPNSKISKRQSEEMLKHWLSTKGVKYPFSKAFTSAFDCVLPESIKKRSLKKEQFCSEGVMRSLQKGALIPENLLARYYTPQELFELLVDIGFTHFKDMNPNSIYS